MCQVCCILEHHFIHAHVLLLGPGSSIHKSNAIFHLYFSHPVERQIRDWHLEISFQWIYTPEDQKCEHRNLDGCSCPCEMQIHLFAETWIRSIEFASSNPFATKSFYGIPGFRRRSIPVETTTTTLSYLHHCRDDNYHLEALITDSIQLHVETFSVILYRVAKLYRRLEGVSSPLGRPPRNREIISCRAWVCAVAMLGGNASQTSCVCFSLFPFAATAFQVKPNETRWNHVKSINTNWNQVNSNEINWSKLRQNKTN